MELDDCIFCKIVDGRIHADLVFQDEVCAAFRDLDPQAPTHILIVPKDHIESLDKASESDSAVLGHLLLTAANISRSHGFSQNGYRTVINTNKDGGQTVYHLHLHLLAGRPFTFPPG
jgi:histidine triad (HIT) family protein